MLRAVLWVLLLVSVPLYAKSTMTPAWAEQVDASTNLYRVDDRLYRSQQPIPANRADLEALGIRTVVNLRFFNRKEDKKVFGQSNIDAVSLPLMTWHITPKNVADALWLIEQGQRRGPVLIHCYHGSDRTGLISAMYRVVYQNWPLDEARREMQQGGFGYHSIWRNIHNFFTDDNVAAIKAELALLRSQPQLNAGAFSQTVSPNGVATVAVF